MPWEFGPDGGGKEWSWTQNPSIGSTNGLMPLGNDRFIAWGCASDSLVEAFLLQVSLWSNDRPSAPPPSASPMVVGERYDSVYN